MTRHSNEIDLAFARSLIGGILITFGSTVGMLLGVIGRPLFCGMGGMMSGYYGYPYVMGGYGNCGFYVIMYALDAVGLILGILVIVFANLMRSKPADRKTYEILILAFSLVSFVWMEVFFIGAILGMVGGVVALGSTLIGPSHFVWFLLTLL